MLVYKKEAILAFEECREVPSREFRVADRHLREARMQVRTTT